MFTSVYQLSPFQSLDHLLWPDQSLSVQFLVLQYYDVINYFENGFIKVIVWISQDQEDEISELKELVEKQEDVIKELQTKVEAFDEEMKASKLSLEEIKQENIELKKQLKIQGAKFEENFENQKVSDYWSILLQEVMWNHVQGT